MTLMQVTHSGHKANAQTFTAMHSQRVSKTTNGVEDSHD